MEQPAIEDISNMNDFNWEVGAPGSDDITPRLVLRNISLIFILTVTSAVIITIPLARFTGYVINSLLS